MPDLLIGFDSGASLTKALYQAQDKKIQFLTMEPELLALPYSSIKSHRQRRIGFANPEDEAWVQCNKKEEKCVVVGFLARDFRAFARMDLLKYEQSLYKLLAVVGAVWEKSGLPEKFSVGITCLLPASEYPKRDQLESELKKRLKSFYFRGQHLRVVLEVFDCLPEGGGVALARMNANGLDWFARQSLVVLMFGHRDTSCLVFQRGVMKDGVTAKLGFYQLVDKVIGRTFDQNPNNLTKAIYGIGEDINPNNEILRTLIKSEETRNIEIEAKQLAQAMKAARQEQWILLQNFTDANLPSELNELSVVGGFAHYLEREISHHLQWATPRWETELQAEVKKMLNLNRLTLSVSEANALACRFVDVYGSFIDLVGKQQETSAVA